MIIHKSYKFRLKPTEEQVTMLKQHGGNTRFVWNKLLEYANNIKKDTDKYPKQSQLQKQIINIKAENSFVKLSHSQPIQINAMRLAETFIRAFKPETVRERNKKMALANKITDETKKTKAIAKALNFGFPKFKKKSNNNDSIFYPQNFIIKKSRIHFPKLGWINYIKHREIEGKPKFLTITTDGNQFYVSITSELEIKEKAKPLLDKADIVGIDTGLKVFAQISDGSKIENPRTLKKYLRKIKRESKSLSRKEFKETGEVTSYGKIIKKSSKNRDKQIAHMQRIYKRIRDIRKDFLHKTSHYIITKYDGVILEDLDIQSMLKKNSRAMNRNTLDVSWYELGRMLEYKSFWNSKYFCKIDRYYPSTQKCSKCGGIARLTIADRTYMCPICGNVMDRDYNSSIIIRDEGLRILKNTVATTEMQACGQTPIGGWTKQEKRRSQSPMAIA